MVPSRIALGCVIFLGVAPMVRGQQVVRQTIQLPTFHSFSVSTSVVVPDRGTAVLGGVDRAAYGSSRFGVPGGGRLFGNRSAGADVSSARAFASATVIDHAELDKAVLSAAAARRGASRDDSDLRRKAEFLNRHIARTGSSRTGPASPGSGLRPVAETGRRVASGGGQWPAPR